jgi:hypothetical protein
MGPAFSKLPDVWEADDHGIAAWREWSAHPPVRRMRYFKRRQHTGIDRERATTAGASALIRAPQSLHRELDLSRPAAPARSQPSMYAAAGQRSRNALAV